MGRTQRSQKSKNSGPSNQDQQVNKIIKKKRDNFAKQVRTESRRTIISKLRNNYFLNKHEQSKIESTVIPQKQKLSYITNNNMFRTPIISKQAKPNHFDKYNNNQYLNRPDKLWQEVFKPKNAYDNKQNNMLNSLSKQNFINPHHFNNNSSKKATYSKQYNVNPVFFNQNHNHKKNQKQADLQDTDFMHQIFDTIHFQDKEEIESSISANGNKHQKKRWTDKDRKQ